MPYRAPLSCPSNSSADEFLGEWDVESVLTSVELPFGPEVVPDMKVGRGAQQGCIACGNHPFCCAAAQQCVQRAFSWFAGGAAGTAGGPKRCGALPSLLPAGMTTCCLPASPAGLHWVASHPLRRPRCCRTSVARWCQTGGSTQVCRAALHGYAFSYPGLAVGGSPLLHAARLPSQLASCKRTRARRRRRCGSA